MSAGEFSVYQFFLGDSYEEVARFIDAESAVRLAKQLTESVGAKIGSTRRVIITDGGYLCELEDTHDPSTHATQEANARLIAAAPELLAACVEALPLLGEKLNQ